MNNTLVGFLKSFINLILVLATITGLAMIYRYYMVYMTAHIIFYTLCFIFISILIINCMDNLCKTILSRSYFDDKELKDLADYIVDITNKREAEKEKEKELSEKIVNLAD